MKRNKLTISKAGRSHTSVIITGVIIASLISVLLTALVTNFILNGHLREKNTTAIIFVIRTISLLIGALIGASLLKQNYLKIVGLITAGYLIIMIGTGIVFFDESFKNFLLGVASVLIGGIAALIILQTPKRNHVKHKKFAL